MVKVIHDQENQEASIESQIYNEFPPPTYEKWRNTAEKSLKGASFEEKLISQTYEGITLQPMYRKEDIENLSHISTLPGEAPYVRGNQAFGYQEKPWEICQELNYPTSKEFNQAAKSDLKRGQTMLNLVLDQASSLGQDPDQASADKVGSRGVSICSLQDIEKALEGIDLEQTPFLIQTGCVGLPIYSMVVAHAKAAGMDLTKLRGSIGMDPLGSLVTEGTIPFSLQKAYDVMADYTKWAKEETPKLKTILVQGDPYHRAGGNAVHELAFSLATSVEYIREMQKRGLTLEEISPRILFSFEIGSNFFMEIAKLRAARLLWSRIISAFGGSEELQKMTIHARTSSWNKTVYDLNVNILRGTSEAFAAIIGGVDSLHVSPYDETVRPPDEFSRRIARNTQIILDKEVHLSKVTDIAGGSWYVEVITDSLAQLTWKQFQQIEKNGGMFQSFNSGYVQEQIKEIANKRLVNISQRKDKFVGTNVYPDLSEQKLLKTKEEREVRESIYQSRCVEVVRYRRAHHNSKKEAQLKELRKAKDKMTEVSIQAFQEGVTLNEWIQAITHHDKVSPYIQPLQIHRGAEQFEALRFNAERYKEKHGSYPKVFLANLGSVTQFKARADFVTGFMEVGGFEVISNNGFETVEEAAQAAHSSGAEIIVICSNDKTYLEMIPLLARKLKQENAEIILYVAGQPNSEEALQLKEDGVDDFISIHSNCYNMLLHLQQRKGIGA